MTVEYPKKLTLPDYQSLIRQLVKKRGFENETVSDVFMLLIEEIGELAKATRKRGGLKVDQSSKIHQVEEEAADVFWLLVDICNRLDVDLEKAFISKEHKNQTRLWT